MNETFELYLICVFYLRVHSKKGVIWRDVTRWSRGSFVMLSHGRSARVWMYFELSFVLFDRVCFLLPPGWPCPSPCCSARWLGAAIWKVTKMSCEQIHFKTHFPKALCLLINQVCIAPWNLTAEPQCFFSYIGNPDVKQKRWNYY